jgi:hypothetical protein
MMLRADDAALAVLENRATAGVLLIRKPLFGDALIRDGRQRRP